MDSGSAAGVEGGLEVEFFGGAALPAVIAEGAAAFEGGLQGVEFGGGLRAVDAGDPVGGSLDRPFVNRDEPGGWLGGGAFGGEIQRGRGNSKGSGVIVDIDSRPL